MSDPLTAIANPGLASSPQRAVVLLVGLGAAEVEALRGRLGAGCEVLAVTGREAGQRLLATRRVAVVCLGERCAGEEARRFIAEEPPAAETAPPPPLHIVAAAGPDPDLFQELVAEDRIFYLTQRPPAADELAALIQSAVRQFALGRAPRGPRPAGESAGVTIEIPEVLRQLASHPSPAERAEVLARAVREILDAERAYCLLYDPEDDTLVGRAAATGEERRESAAVGIASFVLRSGMGLLLPRSGRDPRYDREADDPEGDGSERLIAAPIACEDGRVSAVLVAVRPAGAAELTTGDLDSLARLAAAVAPFLPLPDAEEIAQRDAALFRREALEHYQLLEEPHDPLRISPAWTRWSYWTLLAALVAALLFSLVFDVREYASGTGVVWVGNRDEVTADAGGTVGAVEVAPGQRVEAGQMLVLLHGAQEAAELARIDQELELQLINRLRDPSDPGPEQALIALRTQRQLASARLGERVLRAPSAGTVSDVRVRPGQYLTAGQPVLAIAHDAPTGATGAAGAGPAPALSVVVVLPGEVRPLLRRGMPIRFEIAGYRYAYQRLTVDTVGDEVVGPNEARRYLGQEIGDAVQVNGPVVLAKARLPGPTFVSEGRTYRFHNGMHGTVEVEVRSEKILLTLVPGLKALLRQGRP